METSEDNFGLIIFKQKKILWEEMDKKLNSPPSSTDLTISAFTKMMEENQKNITRPSSHQIIIIKYF